MKKALVLALIAGLLVTIRTAPGAEAAGRASLATSYVCDFGQGSGILDVTVGARLPRKVPATSNVPRRPIKVSVVLPADTVKSMRQFGVEAVSAKAKPTALRVGPERVGVRRLRVPRTDLPVSGPLTLRAQGRLLAFSVPVAGRYAVRVPKRLGVALTAYRGDGSTYGSTLACGVAPQAPTRLGTLRVRD